MNKTNKKNFKTKLSNRIKRTRFDRLKIHTHSQTFQRYFSTPKHTKFNTKFTRNGIILEFQRIHTIKAKLYSVSFQVYVTKVMISTPVKLTLREALSG